MALFRRNPPAIQDSVLNPVGPSQPNTIGQDHQVTDQFVSQAAGIEITPVLETEKLSRAAHTYADSWKGIDTIIEHAQLTDVVVENTIGSSVEMPDGSGRVVKARKTNHEVRDVLLMTVLSARVRAVDRHAEDYTPFIYAIDRVDYSQGTDEDKTSLAIFDKMRQLATILESEYAKVESSMKTTLYELGSYLQKAGTDTFMSWLREASLDDEMATVMEMIAQDVHDPRRGSLVESIGAEIEADNSHALVGKFAEVIDQQDGELEKEAEIMTFVADSLRANGITADMAKILTNQPIDKWPEDVRKSFSAFKQARKRDIETDLRRLTEGYYKRTRRLPSIEDLKKLEQAKIDTAEEQEVRARTGKMPKRTSFKGSQDHIITEPVEVKKPKEAQVALARLVSIATREIAMESGNPESVMQRVIDQYAAEYKLDASQLRVAEADIKKMIKALQLDATRNYGVTKLSDVRPFKSGGQQHTLWRLNPAHYNGLSVSRRGKDTRVLYTISNSGVVGILGAYSHDDYEAQIKNLR